MTADDSGAADKKDLPQFCDFFCEHADFTDPEAVGACRKVAAVYCKILKKMVPKNGPCLARQEG